MLGLYAWFFWNNNLGNLTTLNILYISLAGFGIGFFVAIILKIYNIQSDLNLSNTLIVIFAILLYSFLGDVSIKLITIGTILTLLLLAGFLSLLIGILTYFLLIRRG
jgi:hypothetical protein